MIEVGGPNKDRNIKILNSHAGISPIMTIFVQKKVDEWFAKKRQAIGVVVNEAVLNSIPLEDAWLKRPAQ
jgi:hypothetical protein